MSIKMLNRKKGDKIQSKKGFLQISFAWLFAIIIGAIILFFAIYASVKLIDTEESAASAEIGKEIVVLLNPLETGFGEEKTTPLSIPVESRINNGCENFGGFGEQRLSVSQRISGKWTDAGIEQIFYNKYIFSNKSVQGKNFYLFSKPFEFPFKVSDLIFLTSSEDKYCFSDAPEEIKEELRSLGQGNIFIENCPADIIKVCFDGGTDCNIEVDAFQKTVEKDGELVYYETDALMYAAIFSDADLYECQVQRLMKRLEALALLYNEKEAVISEVGCLSEVSPLGLAEAANSATGSFDLVIVKTAADNADRENKRAYCELW